MGSAAESGPDRTAWFREARYGLFIHWGLYAVPAGSYQGRKIDRGRNEGNGLGEWIMHNAKIPVAEYAQYARQFNPVKFDADAWVRLAVEAGMEYIVITTKHHDGFAMFKSAASPFNMVDATPFGRDPLKELAEACARHGIKLGFYYSHAQDWLHAGGAGVGAQRRPVVRRRSSRRPLGPGAGRQLRRVSRSGCDSAGTRAADQLRPDFRLLVGYTGRHDAGAVGPPSGIADRDGDNIGRGVLG